MGGVGIGNHAIEEHLLGVVLVEWEVTIPWKRLWGGAEGRGGVIRGEFGRGGVEEEGRGIHFLEVWVARRVLW